MGRLVPEHMDHAVKVEINLNINAKETGEAVEGVVWSVAIAALLFNRLRRKP